MFCRKCGNQLVENSRFCSNCGEKVLEWTMAPKKVSEPSNLQTSKNDHEHFSIYNENESTAVDQEIAATAEPSLNHDKRATSRFLKIVPILLPIISFLFISGGVSVAYYNETNKNEEVLALQQSAETAALNGDYSKAEDELQRALDIRPTYPVLQQNLEVVNLALAYMDELTLISDQMREQKFSEAETNFFSLKEKIESEVDPLFDPFAELLAAKEVTITVGKIKQELSELTTVDQLAAKLTRMATLSTEEAAAVKEQILTKITQISRQQAQQQLENKQFSAAIATLDQALKYVVDHQSLLSFKEKIVQEQTAFEQAEQTRLEQAMEAAAKEELLNETAAVEVTSFQFEVDEFGDLYIKGEVTNVATRDISSVTIEFTVYDLEGNHLYDSSTSVYPFYLSRGEKGSFEDTVFYLFEEVNVEIENITWYVE